MPLDARPLDGYRYDPARFPDASDVTAPPYDVINAAMRERLTARSPANIVHADLPLKSGTDFAAGVTDEEAPYRRSADLLAGWIREGTLVRDPRPFVLAYRQEFTVGTARHVRSGVMLRVRLAEFSEGVVLPHEQTFSGPKRDRFLLTKATGLQLSPIFGLYADPGDEVLGPLRAKFDDRTARGRQTATDVFGVRHEVVPVDDPAALARLQAALAARTVTIADGHHRYETALNWRRELIATGRMKADDREHPANFCLFVLVGLADPGLLVLPTHRVARWSQPVPGDAIRDKLAAAGSLTRSNLAPEQLAAFEADLFTPANKGAVGLWFPTEKSVWTWRPTSADPLAPHTPERSPAWRSLDVAVLHELILNRLLAAPTPTAGKVELQYPHSAPEALTTGAAADRVRAADVVFLLRPTPVESLHAVTAARELMPQKSTYFYPKLLTGLVINPVS